MQFCSFDLTLSKIFAVIHDEQIQIFVKALKDVSEYDFSEYSPKSLKRRVNKILEDYDITFEQLIIKIRMADPEFIDQLVADLMVYTTEFFRDPVVWQAIKYRILPKFQNYETIDIWHAGCSTGQEVYSMLILLNELGMLDKARVYASDISPKALEKAKEGVYHYRFNIEQLKNFDEVIRRNPYNFEEYNDVPYSKYFDIDPVEDKLAVKRFLVEKVTYKRQDIVKLHNIFYKKFDIIFCRNVLIYFNKNLQAKVINFLHENLRYPGYLILGYHETILGPEALKFYKKGYYFAKRPE